MNFILSGSGFILISPMFYGYYSGTYSFEFNDIVYKFPLAYFLVMFVVFFVNLGFLVRSFSKFAATESSELSQAPLSELIYSAWDYRTNEYEMAKVMKLDISGMILNRKYYSLLSMIISQPSASKQ